MHYMRHGCEDALAKNRNAVTFPTIELADDHYIVFAVSFLYGRRSRRGLP